MSAHDFEPPAYKPYSSRPPAGSGARQKMRLASAGDVYGATKDIHDAHQEHFITFSLDVRHRVIARRTVAIGTLTGVEVHPRELFRAAIADGAAALICVHNHPSGEPTPSRMDLDLTDRLRKVGELCGIPLLDHVIVTADGWTSLADTWAPIDQLP